MKGLFSRVEQMYYDEPEKTLYLLDTLTELDGYIEAAKKMTEETAFAPNVDFVDRNFDSLRAMKRKIESGFAEIQAVSDQGIVLHYKFDSGSGEMAHDSSGEGHDGTIHGAMWVDGTAGKALEFDGVDDYVGIGSLELADTDYTIEAWIRPKEDLISLSDPYKDVWFASGGDYYIVGPQAWDRHSLKISNGRLSLHHRNKSSNIFISSPPLDFRAGRWYHVAGTFSKTNGMSLYINGELVAFDDNKVQPSTWSVHVIGASGGASGFNQFFKGTIDDVRIYRRELPYAEIKRHYQKR
jgi:hypothetical protein